MRLSDGYTNNVGPQLNFPFLKNKTRHLSYIIIKFQSKGTVHNNCTLHKMCIQLQLQLFIIVPNYNTIYIYYNAIYIIMQYNTIYIYYNASTLTVNKSYLQVWYMYNLSILILGLYNQVCRPAAFQFIFVINNITLFWIQVGFRLQPSVRKEHTRFEKTHTFIYAVQYIPTTVTISRNKAV